MSRAFEPLAVGPWKLPQRFVMAPLTRNRAGEGNAPTELNAEYYAQRASAGLIITEGTQITPEGKGYIQTPGIYSAAQIAGWKAVDIEMVPKRLRLAMNKTFRRVEREPDDSRECFRAHRLWARCVAAARSTLSTPTPARPMTLRLDF